MRICAKSAFHEMEQGLKLVPPVDFRDERAYSEHLCNCFEHSFRNPRGEPGRTGRRQGMAEITLQGVTKSWDAAYAVKGIDFHVREGSFTVLLGPSGCGKSTTLRLIAGLDKPTSGRIHIGGRDVTHLPPAQRSISMVFQSYALFPHLTSRENILFGLHVRKRAGRRRATPPEARRRAARADRAARRASRRSSRAASSSAWRWAARSSPRRRSA